MKKQLTIILALLFAVCSVDVSAQGFLNALKKEAQKQVIRQTEKAVKSAAGQAGSGQSSTKQSNRRASSDRSGRSAKASAGKFEPRTKRVVVKLSEGLGRPLNPLVGRVGGVSPEPPTTGPAVVRWIDALGASGDFTNERIVNESVMLTEWIRSGKAVFDPVAFRESMASLEVSRRVRAASEAFEGLMKRAGRTFPTDMDEFELYDEMTFSEALDNDDFKRIMRSPLDPLFPYLSEEIVAFIKSIDVNNYTVELLAYAGGSAYGKQVRVDSLWYEVNPSNRTAKLLSPQSTYGLTELEIPSTITYEGRQFNVDEIANEAFCNDTSLTTIHFPSTLRKICSNAFVFSKIVRFDLPSSLTELEPGAFSAMPHLLNIAIPDAVKKLPRFLCASCPELQSVTLPEQVDEMGNGLFDGCKSLVHVDLPQNITKLPDMTFHDCKRLAKVELPSSITTIGQCAFLGCSSLKTLPLTDSIHKLEWRAFSECTGLTSVAIPSYVELDMLVFEKCSSLRAASIGIQYKTDPMLSDIVSSIFSGCPVAGKVKYVE